MTAEQTHVRGSTTSLDRRHAPPPRPLRFSLGVAVWCAGAALFGLLAAWAAQHSLFPGEQELSKWLQHRRISGLLGYEEFADFIGARTTLYFLTGAGLLTFAALRWWSLTALVVAAPLLTLLGHLLKVIVERPRPAADQVVAIREPATGFSFPSGHSLQAAIICAVAIIIAQQLLNGRPRRVVQLLAIWLAATIGWERVFDGVHWPTDVVGGLLLGFLATAAVWRGITSVGAGVHARRADAAR